MSVPLLLGAARVVIAISTVAAFAVHAWLTIGHGWLPYLAIAALLIGAIGGRTWRRGTQAVLLAVGHVWPLLCFFALGRIDVLTMTVWVSAVASLALATSPLARWSLPPRWQIPVAAWGMLIVCGWPIIAARELDFTLITYFENGTLNGLWTGGPRDTGAFVVGASAAVLASIVIVDWLWARYGTRSDERFIREVAAPLSVGTIAAIVLGIYQGTVDLRWWSADVWPGLGRAASTLLDANAFGSVTVMWAVPIAGVAMLAERRAWRAFGLVLLALSTVAVWACGSRTALLGLLPAIAGIGVALLRAGRVSRRVAAIAVVAVIVAIVVGWTVGGPGSALRRVWQTLPSMSVESLTSFGSDMWVRNNYGSGSAQMVRDYPLVGVGPGSFAILAPDYSFRMTGRLIPPDNAQNWWRHQWTELGVIAGLVPISCSLLVFVAVIAAIRRRDHPSGIVIAGTVIAVGAMSMLGSPVAYPIVLVTMAVLVFWLSKTVYGSSTAATPLEPGATSRIVMAIALIWVLPPVWAGATLWTAMTQLRPPYRAELVGWTYAYGFSAPEPAPDGSEQRWVAHRAVGVLPALGKQLVLRFRGPHDEATTGPTRVRVRTRQHIVLEKTLAADDIATATITFPEGQKWMMVQIETSRRGPVVEGHERSLQISYRVE